MLQCIKVYDNIGTTNNGSKDESQSNAFGEKRNVFLELQDKCRRSGDCQDDEKSGVDFTNVLHKAFTHEDPKGA